LNNLQNLDIPVSWGKELLKNDITSLLKNY